MDPYQSCPCGSGKSFKWCCQPYYQIVEKARNQNDQGQHEAALRTIQQLVQQHPNLAPPLGFLAELLYLNGKSDDADEALQKAFAINPDFPFGHWLRGVIRKDEGEIVGALLQFRRAAELYDSKAHDALAEINSAIFDIEMRMNRPVAAREALERAIHHDPTAEQLRAAFNNLFGESSRLPMCARKEYSCRPAALNRAEAWKAVLPDKEQARLGDAAAAFEKLTAQDESDAAAWFNLGLARAWLGNNGPAIEALHEAIDREVDEARNAESGALIEILRCGQGMEDLADYFEHRVFFQIQNAQPVIDLLEQWQRSRRLSGAESNQENGTFSAIVLEEAKQFGAGIGSTLARISGYLFIVQNIIRLWHSNKEAVSRLADEIVARVGQAVSPPMLESGQPNFTDVTLDAMAYPTTDLPIDDMGQRMGQHARDWFEETWMQKPLKSLSGVSPLDTVGQPGIRKRLAGVLRFMEECFLPTVPRRVVEGQKSLPLFEYDFNRLRRKLGLSFVETVTAESGGQKIDALSTAELAALNANALSDVDLETAFRTALKMDAADLASKFARVLTDRPAVTDCFLPFNHLIQLAQSEGDTAGVLALLDRAEKADADSNGGKRQNDYAVRRGQVLARRGEVDKSHEVFQTLLAREPNELKLYGPAIEAMLGQKQGQRALQFAEQGLARARSQNNRDSEQYFLELAAAAQKLA
jgi:tetratricopeptide (TPR) repeat protein